VLYLLTFQQPPLLLRNNCPAGVDAADNK